MDGAGALLKPELRKEQMKPNAEKIQNAADAVAFLKREANKHHAGPSSSRRVVDKHFWLVNKEDVDRSESFDCSTVHGSRSMFQARSVNCRDQTLIAHRNLSCFCVAGENPGSNFACEEEGHVRPWKIERLKPISSSVVRRRMALRSSEVEYGGDGEQMSHDAEVGDNIAVLCDSGTNEEF